MKRAILFLAAGLAVLSARPLCAAEPPPPFDLSGPTLRVTVSRQGKTLPIGAVPQLAAGDRLRVDAQLPADETAHYLLVAAFLRDPTNPPPDKWFYKSETWEKPSRGRGSLDLTIPPGAQHLILLLAPATGGDFGTLRSAIKARPGAFVRAAQDLEQASLDRSRYQAYLSAIRRTAENAPDTLAHVAPVVAGSLRIKINEDCLQRMPELQAACLLDAKQAIVLGNDDSPGTATLSDAAADLALTISATPVGGLGYYSPYISAVREIVGIFSAMHTAQYQYIPALDVPSGDQLALVLNMPPSFSNPKSVLMAALPEVTASHPPVLAMTPGAPAPCLGARQPVLPMAVSPLFYATAYAHDLKLHVTLPGQAALDLPVMADAMRGGLVVGDLPAMPGGLAGTVSASVVGMWGFDPFASSPVTLQTAGDWTWQPQANARDDGQWLLEGATAACVSAVTITPPHGSAQPASWRITGPHEIAVTYPALPPAMGDRHEPLTLAIMGPEGTTPAALNVTPPAKAPPPSARIVAHNSEPSRPDPAQRMAITLDGPDEIPADTRLSFTLKAGDRELFTGREVVEIGTADGDTTARLTLGNGLVRLDPTILVASLIPSQALGLSAFGPMRARMVRGNVVGDWLSLGTLVRLPRLKQLSCPPRPAAGCTLTGDGLYLLAAIAPTRDFDNPVSVPEGYPGFTLAVPRPVSREGLFVRLHDAPEVVNHMGVVDAATASR